MIDNNTKRHRAQLSDRTKKIEQTYKRTLDSPEKNFSVYE